MTLEVLGEAMADAFLGLLSADAHAASVDNPNLLRDEPRVKADHLLQDAVETLMMMLTHSLESPEFHAKSGTTPVVSREWFDYALLHSGQADAFPLP